ncbi:MAG: PD-(D/E)XK nuclease family protein [Verrucomicrobiota bacterium]
MAEFAQGELFDEPETQGPKRIFLGWERPLIDSAGEYLLPDPANESPDLAHLLILVSTQQAGRRLRETLAIRAGSDAGIFNPPMVATPRFLLHPLPQSNVAPEATELKVWIDVLLEFPMRSLRHLFPVEPPERNFNWALQVASQILKVRRTIAESGWRPLDVAKNNPLESDRWTEISNLEKESIRRLQALGFNDPLAAEKLASTNPEVPPGIKKIILLAVPDPFPPAIPALKSLSDNIEIEVAIQAPDSLARNFDEWGRPLPDYWTEAEIPIPDADSTLHVCRHPHHAAKQGIQLLERNDTPEESAAFCLCDPDWTAEFKLALEDAGRGGFDPSGIPFYTHEIACVLKLLRTSLQSGEVRDLGEFLRLEDVQNSLAGRFKFLDENESHTFNSARMLVQFDEVFARHLPSTIDDLKRVLKRGDHRELAFATREIEALLDEFKRSEKFSSAITSFFSFVFAVRKFEEARAFDRHFLHFASLLEETLVELDDPAFQTGPQRSASEKIDLLLQLLSPQTAAFERKENDFDLNGWLEVPWEDAPHLIIAGMQDGVLPESISSDSFLPHSLRRTLGLRTNEERYARDAYLLSAALHTRQSDGRVDVLLARHRENGEPLRPSRLLYHCPDNMLTERALHLFSNTLGDDNDSNLAWSAAWKLTPPAVPDDHRVFQRISITQFSKYLNCPFRFYLGSALAMEPVDPSKAEMDARDFGILCHAALERLAEDESLRDSSSESDVAKFLVETARSLIDQQFGMKPAASIRIQTESICERLSAAGRIIAQEKQKGWRQYKPPEWKIHEHHDFQIGGMQVTGTIDWIERHEETGVIRILDFKTANKATPPEAAHLKNLGRTESSEDFPEQHLTENSRGKKARWINLQLPLYLLAMRELEPKGTQFETGYFQLPIAVTETGIQIWEDLDNAHLESARGCAEHVVAGIQSRQFWPPAVDPKYDDFASILFEAHEKTIDEERFNSNWKASAS